jgi:hypothetical protein
LVLANAEETEGVASLTNDGNSRWWHKINKKIIT